MPHVRKILTVPFSSAQMYMLVNDVDKYPQFLTWCTQAKVHERTATRVTATLYIAKGPVQHSVTTVNSLEENRLVKLEYIDGPFKSFTGYWLFETAASSKNHCRVIFELEYTFASRLLSLAIEPIFNSISNSLVESFCNRAEQLYGR